MAIAFRCCAAVVAVVCRLHAWPATVAGACRLHAQPAEMAALCRLHAQPADMAALCKLHAQPAAVVVAEMYRFLAQPAAVVTVCRLHAQPFVVCEIHYRTCTVHFQIPLALRHGLMVIRFSVNILSAPVRQTNIHFTHMGLVGLGSTLVEKLAVSYPIIGYSNSHCCKWMA